MSHAYRLLALALATWLVACGDDTANACLPAQVRGTCVDELSQASQGCFDPGGACKWSQTDGGLTFEWANGARIESTSPLTLGGQRTFGSDGSDCGHSTRIETDSCDGFRNEIDGMWVDACTDRSTDKVEAIRYVCQNGREYRVAYTEDLVDVDACRSQGPSLDGCVDEDGVKLGDR